MRSEQIGPFRRSNENFIDNFGSCMRFERFVSVSSSDQWNERNRTLTSLKFGSHDGLSRDGYVVSRTHWGISRSDNRHSMRTIWRIQLWDDTTQPVSAGRIANLGSGVKTHFWVPYSNLQRTFFDRFEQHWCRPLPLMHDDEESRNAR